MHLKLININYKYVYNSYYFTKIAVALQPFMLDPQFLWDFETKDTELKLLPNTLNPNMKYLWVAVISS